MKDNHHKMPGFTVYSALGSTVPSFTIAGLGARLPEFALPLLTSIPDITTGVTLMSSDSKETRADRTIPLVRNDPSKRPSAVARLTSWCLTMNATPHLFSGARPPPSKPFSRLPDYSPIIQLSTPMAANSSGSQAALELLACFAPILSSIQARSRAQQLHPGVEHPDSELFVDTCRSMMEELECTQRWVTRERLAKYPGAGNSRLLVYQDFEAIHDALAALMKIIEAEITEMRYYGKLVKGNAD